MVKTRGRARKPAALKSVYSEYRRIANDHHYSTRRHLYNNFWDEVNNKVEEELKPKKAKAKTKTKNPVCPSCNYLGTIKNGFNAAGIQRYKCKHCEKIFYPQPTKPVKAKNPIKVKTLDELKQIKELKDQIEALKARITRKDATIKSLKRQNEKLKNPVEKKKKEDHDKNFYVDNPDFLEIL